MISIRFGPLLKSQRRRSLSFFGVETEINSFGLRKFFDNTSSVLITIPSIFTNRGTGITTQIIRQLLDSSRLKGIDFSVEVMASYSGAYRGFE